MSHEELRWDPAMEARLRQVEACPVAEAGQLLQEFRRQGLSNGAIYLTLAAASAHWVDHHGPLVGHGTFNGGPLLRAEALLDASHRQLSLLHATAYVLDLLQHANYGPTVMLAMEPEGEPAAWTDEEAFLTAVESGREAWRAEHRAVGLLRTFGPAVRWPLLRAAIRSYPENEHRLLIVWRAVQLLDDTEGWAYAEGPVRAAVQYLASRPDLSWAEALSPEWRERQLPVDAPAPVDEMRHQAWVDRLVDCPPGSEPAVLLEAWRSGVGLAALADMTARASSLMLYASGYDAHAVTGVHAALDLVRGPDVPTDIRRWALGLALCSQRTRRQKAVRSSWAGTPQGGSTPDLTEVLRLVRNDPTGLEAGAAAGRHVAAGGEVGALYTGLMEAALVTAGPFSVIHNVKMLWGLYQETLHGRPSSAVAHARAAARVVAATAGAESADAIPVLAQWGGKGRSGLPREER